MSCFIKPMTQNWGNILWFENELLPPKLLKSSYHLNPDQKYQVTKAGSKNLLR